MIRGISVISDPLKLTDIIFVCAVKDSDPTNHVYETTYINSVFDFDKILIIANDTDYKYFLEYLNKYPVNKYNTLLDGGLVTLYYVPPIDKINNNGSLINRFIGSILTTDINNMNLGITPYIVRFFKDKVSITKEMKLGGNGSPDINTIYAIGLGPRRQKKNFLNLYMISYYPSIKEGGVIYAKI